ncbi:MAG: VCBS repeat-containing protein, partial [Planctomycetales bacterium]|nr:VCBS repeat-containing protein [Planctomycetales bacterium]
MIDKYRTPNSRCAVERLENRELLTASATFAETILPVRVSDVESYQFRDLDADGSSELVVHSKDSIAIYGSKGAISPHFDLSQSIDSHADQIDFADLDGDRRLDLLLADVASGVRWHRNLGASGFDDNARPLAEVSGVAEFSPFDMEHDGDVDVAVSFQDGVILTLENENHGTNFSLHQLLVSEMKSTNMRTASIASDVQQDLLLTNAS